MSLLSIFLQFYIFVPGDDLIVNDLGLVDYQLECSSPNFPLIAHFRFSNVVRTFI